MMRKDKHSSYTLNCKSWTNKEKRISPIIKQKGRRPLNSGNEKKDWQTLGQYNDCTSPYSWHEVKVNIPECFKIKIYIVKV